MTHFSLRPLLQAFVLATLPATAGVYELGPITERQATEYRLESAFYKKGILV